MDEQWMAWHPGSPNLHNDFFFFKALCVQPVPPPSHSCLLPTIVLTLLNPIGLFDWWFYFCLFHLSNLFVRQYVRVLNYVKVTHLITKEPPLSHLYLVSK